MKTQQDGTKKSMKIGVDKIALLMAFLVPFVVMLAIFIGNGIYPFGDRSFLFSDMYHQYMPFFQEFMTKIKAGEGLSYSWKVGMGSNFYALYVYYLASPLHWLAFLLPQSHLMEFMSYLVVVKLGLAGLTAFLYLKSRDLIGDDKNLRVLIPGVFCSCMYALSGFVAAYNWNIMWLDCVVLLPLILMGVERIINGKGAGLYCGMLGLCIFSNFYISIMICIFLVLYFLVLLFTEKFSLKACLRFAGASLLAGALAAVLLVPEVCALMATDFGDIAFPEKMESYFSVLDILARHCMGITTERALEHWPNIYCGAFVFLLIPLYVVNEKIPLRRRFGFMALCGFFLISFGTNTLDFIWHGMNYPDSLPARQSFLYILMVLVMCYECLTHLEAVDPKSILKTYLGAVVVFLLIQKFVENTDFMLFSWLLNLAIVTLYAILLYMDRTKTSAKAKIVIACVAFAAVVGEAAANMAITSVGTTSREDYLKDLKYYQALYERNNSTDNGFSRFEKLVRKTKNDGTLAGYPTASVFSSTMNSRVMDFYQRLGMRYSKVFYCYDGATALTSALLNVEYLFGDDKGYDSELLTLVDQEEDIYLYQSNAVLPFGYVLPIGFDLPVEEEENKVKGLNLQNQLVEELGLEGTLFRKRTVEQAGDDIMFTPSSDGIYYGVVSAWGTTKIDVTGGCVEEMHFRDLKRDVVMYLGALEKDQTITFTNGDDSDETPKVSVQVYQLNKELLRETLELLGSRHMTDVKVENTLISGNLVLEEAGRVVLTVPYEKGWKVTVNGEQREPALFGEAFVALDLEPGQYEICLEYVPEGMYAGIWITVVGLIVFALWQILVPVFNKKQKEKHEKSV